MQKKNAPTIEIKKSPEKKVKSEKQKTVAEVDRDKLEKKFSSTNVKEVN